MTEPQHPQEPLGPEPAAGHTLPPARSRKSQRRLITATCIAVVIGFIALALPTPYIVEAPGPAVNTLGKVKDRDVIEVSGRKTYPADGSLDMTTVYVIGGAESRISFFRVIQAWADPRQDVYPEETMYPRGATDEQISDRNAAEMDNSQQNAVAAALTSLEIPFSQQLSVAGLATDANKGKLRTDDVLKAIDGKPITDLDMLKKALQGGDGTPELTVVRGGRDVRVDARATLSGEGQRQLGVYLDTRYTFPLEVTFGLSNVGGPSAGMMFALGIIDTLTPGDMTGGKQFAGTGTIEADGTVGPIGGIAQKLVGARTAGADYFLAPADNCADVVGRVPDGLNVVKVSTLEQARDAVEAIGEGADPASLPSCG
ncbi:MAG TPA: S16 family serine protease [Arthrobacter sp.]|nr:S16 family serine protease [Arthrobacter sp.]